MNTLRKEFEHLAFPLKKEGYLVREILNNKNRWHTKLVCKIVDEDSENYVSTTYARHSDYLKLVETITYLKCNNKLTPEIVGLYSQKNTIICGFLGEYLSDYLLNNPAEVIQILISIFEYLKGINSINQSYKKFTIPSIVKMSLRLSGEIIKNFEFLPKSKEILPEFENSDIKFIYGCGIEDPHIWNFRVIKTKYAIQSLTTDFDYFNDDINYFWEMGYLYATFRWFKRESLSLSLQAQDYLFSFIQNRDLESEFMFWLGALSSYCGYKDSLLNFKKTGIIDSLKEQRQIIQQLDKRIYVLASNLLKKNANKKLIRELI